MTTSKLTHKTTNELKKKERLSTFALNTVYIGAAFAIVASVFAGYRDGIFPETTFYMAIIALLSSIFVYRERKEIGQELSNRRKASLK